MSKQPTTTAPASQFRQPFAAAVVRASDGIMIVLPSGEVFGSITQAASLDAWIAHFDDAGWTQLFATEQLAIQWLTELAEYAAWADSSLEVRQ